MTNPLPVEAAQPKLNDLLNQERQLESDAKKRLVAITREIGVKEAKLGFYNGQLDKVEKSFELRKQELEKAIKKLETQKDQGIVRVEKVFMQVEGITQEKKKAAQALEDVRRDIDERRVYFEQQEAQIEKATEAWSDRMKELASQANQTQKEYDEVLERLSQAYKQLEGLKRDKDLVEAETIGYRERTESARAIYEQTTSIYKKDLAQLRLELDELTQANELESTRSVKREEELDYREKRIDVREQVLEKAQLELEMKRRRLDSDLSLRG